VVNYLFFNLNKANNPINSPNSPNSHNLKILKTKKYKSKNFALSDKLIEYHRDFVDYLNKKILDKPKYRDYVNYSILDPPNVYYENAICSMLENGYTGWENCVFVVRHNEQKINYLMFRLENTYIVVYVKGKVIHDFKIFEC
jgi:hypothetical protein